MKSNPDLVQKVIEQIIYLYKQENTIHEEKTVTTLKTWIKQLNEEEVEQLNHILRHEYPVQNIIFSLSERLHTTPLLAFLLQTKEIRIPTDIPFIRILLKETNLYNKEDCIKWLQKKKYVLLPEDVTALKSFREHSRSLLIWRMCERLTTPAFIDKVYHYQELLFLLEPIYQKRLIGWGYGENPGAWISLMNHAIEFYSFYWEIIELFLSKSTLWEDIYRAPSFKNKYLRYKENPKKQKKLPLNVLCELYPEQKNDLHKLSVRLYSEHQYEQRIPPFQVFQNSLFSPIVNADLPNNIQEIILNIKKYIVDNDYTKLKDSLSYPLSDPLLHTLSQEIEAFLSIHLQALVHSSYSIEYLILRSPLNISIFTILGYPTYSPVDTLLNMSIDIDSFSRLLYILYTSEYQLPLSEASSYFPELKKIMRQPSYESTQQKERYEKIVLLAFYHKLQVQNKEELFTYLHDPKARTYLYKLYSLVDGKSVGTSQKSLKAIANDARGANPAWSHLFLKTMTCYKRDCGENGQKIYNIVNSPSYVADTTLDEITRLLFKRLG